MPLDAKQKKQILIIVVSLVGFGVYEMYEMKKKHQKALATPKTAEVKAEVKKDPGNTKAPAENPLAKVPAVKPEVAVAGGESFKVSKNITPAEKAVFFKRQEELAVKGWGHDPFYPEFVPEAPPDENLPDSVKTPNLPPPESSGTETALKLTGISKIGQTFYATINRKMLQVGDSISGWKVMQIRNEGVTLQKNQRNYELRLGK